MNKKKMVFVWAEEAALRERFHGVLRAHDTHSCHDLGAKSGSKTILISARYQGVLARTARADPASARLEDLSRSYLHLEKMVVGWLAAWRLVDWSDILLAQVCLVDWVVDDGNEMQVATVFAATSKATAVCVADELGARGADFEIDRLLLEIERRHLAGAENGC